MKEMPAWLPDMVSLDGIWKEVLQKLYSIFTIDFKNRKVYYKNMEVWHDNRILAGDKYEEGFWHLISRTDNSTGDRVTDNRRSERLPWCRPVIENSADSAIKEWDNLEGRGKTRTYIWLEKNDYVVILERRKKRKGDIMFLITAYHLDGDSSRKKMNNKYNNRL